MNEINEYNVYWKEINDTTFKYGSRIKFFPGETHFSNELMPSGVVIHEWFMKTSYHDDRILPTLPILKRGETYQFDFVCIAVPESSVYFKITFFQRNGTFLKNIIVHGNNIEFKFPENAYSYKVQMMNAASRSIVFKKIRVIKKVSSTSSTIHKNYKNNRFMILEGILKRTGHYSRDVEVKYE